MADKTLMKTRLFEGEQILGDFKDEHSCNQILRDGLIRRVQLTNRRILYFESRRRWCFFRSLPMTRQIFLKDVSEISLDAYRPLPKSDFQEVISCIIGLILYPFLIFIYIFYKPVPEVVFGTSCTQFPNLAIRLHTKEDRLRLLEMATQLVSKNR